MALSDLVARLLRRPARRVVDAPVRSLVDQALDERQVPSPAEVSRLRAELAERDAALAALGERVDALGRQLEALEEENRRLRTPPAAPCRVDACGAVSSGGAFCVAHDTAWRGGELDGYVGPDGQVRHDGRILRVQSGLAGQPVVVTGHKRLTVKVSGKRVSFRASASPSEGAPR